MKRPVVKISRLKDRARLRAAARLLAASDPWRRLGLDARRCLRTLTLPYRENFRAVIGGEFAGLVTIVYFGTLRGYIQVLFVADGFRGCGVGEALLAFAEKRIFRSSPNVFLCVSSFNAGARRFYRRMGYARAGLLKDFIVKGADEILMRKTRGPLLPGKGKHG